MLFDLLASNPSAFIAISLLIGLLVGSFLNVVIHRLPIMMESAFREECALLDAAEGTEAPQQPAYNLIVPRSACPACGNQIAGYDNIPVISWLILKGRCRHCSQPISARYPLVELTTGLITAGIAWHFGWGAQAFGAILFAWTLIALFGIDADTYLLPDSLTLPLLWAGLLFNWAGTFTSLHDAVIGAAMGYLALWAVYWAFKLATGKEGMGYGDFKLLAAIGAWLGWQSLPVVILLSSVVGAIIGIALTVLARRGWSKPLPFGPYLATAGLAAMFCGPALSRSIWGKVAVSPIRVVGLTGGIGSGKSTVADMFHSLGVPLVDTDLISHQLGQPGGKGSAAVSRLFGSDYLTSSGAMDRGKVRALVFADTQARKQLEGALHPLIRAQVMAELRALPPGTPYCLLIVPLLFETGAYQDLISQAWVVDCSEEQQIARVTARSQLSREQAQAIMRTQLGRQQRLSRADVVIDNGENRESLLATVKELHSKTLQGSESAYKSC